MNYKLQYRNPDTPVGYNKEIKAELKYKEGIEIDGVHCRFLGTIINSGIFEEEDDEVLERLSLLSLSSDEDGEIKVLSPEPIKREVIDLDDEPEPDQNTELKTDLSPKAFKKEVIDVDDEQILSKKKETKTLLSPRSIKKEAIDVDEEPVPDRKKDGDQISDVSFKKRTIKKEYDEDGRRSINKEYEDEHSKRERKKEHAEDSSKRERRKEYEEQQLIKRERRKEYEDEHNKRERRKEYEDEHIKRERRKEYEEEYSKRDRRKEYDEEYSKRDRRKEYEEEHNKRDRRKEYEEEYDEHNKRDRRKEYEEEYDEHYKRDRRKDYEEEYSKKDRRKEYDEEHNKRDRRKEHDEVHIKKERRKEYEDEYSKRERRKEYEEDHSKRVKSKIKQENSDDYYGGSDSSNDSYKRYEKKRYSRSPSPQTFDLKDVKEEPKEVQMPEHLFGSYPCDICHITMNSLGTYNTHITGKRHLKNLKLKCPPAAVSNVMPNVVPIAVPTVAPTVVPSASKEGMLKYPPPPLGAVRKKVKELAKMQDAIDRLGEPCPGLHRVIEIQGIREIQYYCGLCDSLCSSSSIVPHLKGYKHQLKSLKHYKPSLYEKINYEPKYKIERTIMNELRIVEEKEGRGKMTVEREEFICDPKDIGSISSRPSTSKDMPSTSRQNTGMAFAEYYEMTTIPDSSKSDFYCRICESHMNSEAMWQSHIRGKRHLANIKKNPGDRPSKTRTIPLHNTRASLFEQIDDVNEPIIGLDQVQEIQIPETGLSTYQCFLCGASASCADIVEHLTNPKHMLKYLEYIKHPGLGVLHGMRDAAASTLIIHMAQEVEGEEGRGNPSVHVTKSSINR